MGAAADPKEYRCPYCRRPWGVVVDDDRLYVGALEVLDLKAKCVCGNVKAWRPSGDRRPAPPGGPAV